MDDKDRLEFIAQSNAFLKLSEPFGNAWSAAKDPKDFEKKWYEVEEQVRLTIIHLCGQLRKE